MMVNKEDEIRQLMGRVFENFQSLDIVCRSICHVFGLKYLDFEIGDECLGIMVLFESMDDEELKRIVEPFGFEVYYSFCFPTCQFTLQYDLNKEKM